MHYHNYYSPKLDKRVVRLTTNKSDSWDIDTLIAPVVLSALKQYRERNLPCTPGGMFVELGIDYTDNPTDEQCKYAHSKWNEILDKMIFAMEKIASDDNLWEFDEDIAPKVQEGCELFGKWFTSLWD